MVKYEIDPQHTHIGFTAKHLAVSTVRGLFNKFEGSFEGPDADYTKARGGEKGGGGIGGGGKTKRREWARRGDGLAGAVPFGSHTIKLEVDSEIIVKAGDLAEASTKS